MPSVSPADASTDVPVPIGPTSEHPESSELNGAADGGEPASSVPVAPASSVEASGGSGPAVPDCAQWSVGVAVHEPPSSTAQSPDAQAWNGAHHSPASLPAHAATTAWSHVTSGWQKSADVGSNPPSPKQMFASTQPQLSHCAHLASLVAPEHCSNAGPSQTGAVALSAKTRAVVNVRTPAATAPTRNG